MSTKMVSITIDRLLKTFGSHTAIDRVSLRIEPGEIFFLLGPSGCGKTTLLRSIAGFATPDEGRILLGDEDVTHLPPHRRHTAMMFQSYALWPHMTAAKNVAFGLEEQKVPAAEIDKRVREALAAVKMEHHATRKIAELSGGQQQRIALARALVVHPRALLLDEPLSNLDAKLRLEMRAEIRRVCREFGLTAVYVTHDQKEALSIADRIAVMIDGRIAQCGRPEEIYRRPHSRIVADFLGETNFLPGTVLKDGNIQTDLGIFSGIPGPPDWQPASGEAVTLSIRPESWIIGGEPLRNQTRATIGSSVYLGEVAQYQLLAGSHHLSAFELNPRLAAREEGREIVVSAEPEDIVILPA